MTNLLIGVVIGYLASALARIIALKREIARVERDMAARNREAAAFVSALLRANTDAADGSRNRAYWQ